MRFLSEWGRREACSTAFRRTLAQRWRIIRLRDLESQEGRILGQLVVRLGDHLRKPVDRKVRECLRDDHTPNAPWYACPDSWNPETGGVEPEARPGLTRNFLAVTLVVPSLDKCPSNRAPTTFLRKLLAPVFFT